MFLLTNWVKMIHFTYNTTNFNGKISNLTNFAPILGSYRPNVQSRSLRICFLPQLWRKNESF